MYVCLCVCALIPRSLLPTWTGFRRFSQSSSQIAESAIPSTGTRSSPPWRTLSSLTQEWTYLVARLRSCSTSWLSSSSMADWEQAWAAWDPKVSSRSGATTRFWTWQSNKLRYGCVCVSVRCFGMCVLVCVSVVFVCECGSRLFFFCVCVLCVSVFCLCVLVSVRFMGLLFKYYILASN